MGVKLVLQNGAGGGFDGTFQQVANTDISDTITVDINFVISGGDAR